MQPEAWLELQQEDHGIQGPAARVQSREGKGREDTTIVDLRSYVSVEG